MKHSFKTKVLCFIKEKSKYFKVISMILVLALLVQSVSIAVTAITESDMFLESKSTSSTYEEVLPDVVDEVKENRDQYTKVYKLADGSFYEIISTDPLHENVNGEWVEPENDLDMPTTTEEALTYCDELVTTMTSSNTANEISIASVDITDTIAPR